ncbi:MAG TPA: flagellar filament capping protein FliD, partial [Acidobacteriota bacterium]|nr:flagellar filament capping protein FliD [Acidobacteriota bacterium]
RHTAMAGLQLSGLASGFDWKSLVEQLMSVEQVRVTRLEKEQSTNTQRSSALSTLGTKLTALQSAADALKDVSVFSGRKVTSSTTDSTWDLSASAGSAAGSYRIAVSKLATASRLTGTGDIAKGLHTSNDVSGLTLATLNTAATPTAGTFSVNGQKITIATTDSLQSVFDAISTATSGDVTASYDNVTDKVTLTSASNSTITLGAANDTSNFLRALKLSNNGTDTVTSSGALGVLKTTTALASTNLRTAITAVDGSGNGSFSLNGVSISYNVNTDTVAGVISRINASSAGVTASYDAINDRVSLVNDATGDLGISASESAGGLLGALGLTGGTLARGANAEFTVDGGPTLTSTGNTLDQTAHGIAGLSITVDSETTQTIAVASDTAKMREKIDAFVTAFNGVQTYIDEKTKTTSSNGKVTTSVLTSNREVQAWASQLRSTAFAAVSGLSGTIGRLEHLGIDFDGTTGQLVVEDDAKLTTALRDKAADVEEFFQKSSTGFVAKLTTLLDTMETSNEDQQKRLTAANSNLTRQIEDVQRQLDAQKERLMTSFIAMESAQARIQQQGNAITNAFSSTSSSK